MILPHLFANKRRFDAIRGAQHPHDEIIDSDSDGSSPLNFRPSMTAVEIIALGGFDTVNIKYIHWTDNGMNRVLIIEILVKIAIAASVVIGAGSEIDTPFHVMQAGLSSLGQFPHFIHPMNNLPAVPLGMFTPSSNLSVFKRNSLHGLVKMAARAVVFLAAEFVSDDSGLHPHTWPPSRRYFL
jgi:hypothetical protein